MASFILASGGNTTTHPLLVIPLTCLRSFSRMILSCSCAALHFTSHKCRNRLSGPPALALLAIILSLGFRIENRCLSFTTKRAPRWSSCCSCAWIFCMTHRTRKWTHYCACRWPSQGALSLIPVDHRIRIPAAPVPATWCRIAYAVHGPDPRYSPTHTAHCRALVCGR